jgi:hypothetical protein
MGELSSSTLPSYINGSCLTPQRSAAVRHVLPSLSFYNILRRYSPLSSWHTASATTTCVTPFPLCIFVTLWQVHPLNTEQLVESLLAAGKSDFSMQFYPNRDHGIAGRSTRRQLYKSIFAFLVRTLAPPVVLDDMPPVQRQRVQERSGLLQRRLDEHMQY